MAAANKLYVMTAVERTIHSPLLRRNDKRKSRCLSFAPVMCSSGRLSKMVQRPSLSLTASALPMSIDSVRSDSAVTGKATLRVSLK